MDGTGTLQTGPSQVVARDQEVFLRVWKVPSHPSILRFLMSTLWKWSKWSLTSQVYVSGVSRVFPNFLTDGEQQVLLECGQDSRNVSLNLGLFRWNGWIRPWHPPKDAMCLNLEEMTCRSSRVRWVPKFCTELHLGFGFEGRTIRMDAQLTPAISPLKLSEIVYDMCTIYLRMNIQAESLLRTSPWLMQFKHQRCKWVALNHTRLREWEFHP